MGASFGGIQILWPYFKNALFLCTQKHGLISTAVVKCYRTATYAAYVNKLTHSRIASTS